MSLPNNRSLINCSKHPLSLSFYSGKLCEWGVWECVCFLSAGKCIDAYVCMCGQIHFLFTSMWCFQFWLFVRYTPDIRCCRNPHIHILGGSLFLIVSLPVYYSNQCWHTALCGTLGQLGDTYRFCRSISWTTFLSSSPLNLCCFTLLHFVRNLPAVCRSHSVDCQVSMD